MSKMITLFYGGVVNLGRNMNALLKTREPFNGIKEMAEADIRLVDLECVITAKGEQQPLENHFYESGADKYSREIRYRHCFDGE